MKTEIDPRETSRAYAFKMWMKSPMPMVTLLKTLDVSHLVKVSRKSRLKFNMLMCWCACKAASTISEFYLLPAEGKLFRYDRLAVNVIVNNQKGGISLCDIPYSDDLSQFNLDYQRITEAVSLSGESVSLDDMMILGTSAVVETELDGIINQYSGIFNNPFLAWGRYKRSWFKTELKVSFQFHHAQMDGAQAARFLEELQKTISQLCV